MAGRAYAHPPANRAGCPSMELGSSDMAPPLDPPTLVRTSDPETSGMTTFPNLTVISHPLIQHKLAVLRDRRTSKKTFRALVEEITMLMGYEVTQNLPLEPVEIQTPLESMTAYKVSGKKLTLVPVLRAGLGMADGVLRLV